MNPAKYLTPQLKTLYRKRRQEVELRIVKAITAKLIDCKMDQMNQVVILRPVASVETFYFYVCVCSFIHNLMPYSQPPSQIHGNAVKKRSERKYSKISDDYSSLDQVSSVSSLLL
ncbi:unnamed protein product [Eruca vesicaria subsp. sativa]|uniref:PCI domain-containing protein n=1 Tax=Eruca vesicaria subsp. sativa TaxID=29727 RepID=A0ABC8L848_ERUVS|nr:unnamed protein product [Eruca vesicaria subsp. sativa]